MREEFGDDYLIINGAIFLSEIKTYLLRSCLCAETNSLAKQFEQIGYLMIILITIEPQPVLITEQASLAYQCNRSIIA